MSTADALHMAIFKPALHDEFGVNLDVARLLGSRLSGYSRPVGRRSSSRASRKDLKRLSRSHQECYIVVLYQGANRHSYESCRRYGAHAGAAPEENSLPNRR